MADSGVLGQAADARVQDRELAGPFYSMTVEGGKEPLFCNLGWGLPMLQDLVRLRGLLKDEPAKQMDALLGRLSGHFMQWTGKPYEPPK